MNLLDSIKICFQKYVESCLNTGGCKQTLFNVFSPDGLIEYGTAVMIDTYSTTCSIASMAMAPNCTFNGAASNLTPMFDHCDMTCNLKIDGHSYIFSSYGLRNMDPQQLSFYSVPVTLYTTNDYATKYSWTISSYDNANNEIIYYGLKLWQ